jgi:hypothetical protein
MPLKMEVMLKILESLSTESQFLNHGRTDLLELQRLLRNPTKGIQAYIALQYGKVVPVAELAKGVHAELARRNKAWTARNA